MPGKYDPESRSITLNTEFNQEPILTAATLIHGVVQDLLFQREFAYAHFPELVDLAVVGTGLGVVQSQIGFVSETGTFWDSTLWETFPRPFLDGQSLPYALALAAWTRGESSPGWAEELPLEAKRMMQKSLKYLGKTRDSFFEVPGKPIHHENDLDKWIALAGSKSTTTELIAIRQLETDRPTQDLEELLVEKLRSTNRTILLHSIAATERLKLQAQPVIDELRLLAENRDDEVRAKAMIAMTRLAALDEQSINIAARMLDNSAKHVVFAGLMALSSLETVPDHVMPPVNRGLNRALQTCNYEFIGLFSVALNRWLDDPQGYLETLLQSDSPEYLQIALDSLANVQEQMVALQ